MGKGQLSIPNLDERQSGRNLVAFFTDRRSGQLGWQEPQKGRVGTLTTKGPPLAQGIVETRLLMTLAHSAKRDRAGIVTHPPPPDVGVDRGRRFIGVPS
jgi:hypothetical protein